MHRASFVHHQGEIAQIEARTQVMRIFQATVIPGILQTPAYARDLLTKNPKRDDWETPAALAAHVERQTALYDPSRNFEFVIHEAALRARVTTAATLRAQWDRLLLVGSLPNVAMRVLTMDAQLAIIPSATFAMYDMALVIVESLTAETSVRNECDIAIYRH